MDSPTSRTLKLRHELALLKKDEERFRFLVTSVKTSGKYRREAVAKLEATRRRIHAITLELGGTH